MSQYIEVTGLTARNVSEYVAIAMRLASDAEWRRLNPAEVREKSLRYVASKETGDEVQQFLVKAWERKTAGLPNANWISGAWH